VARAEAAGGSILYPVKDIGELGFVGEIADSEGNRIALSQPRA
jgi:predicted enzyme related to lactoylglutathione lyase